MSIAFLFPGQGSQHPNMLHALPNHTEVHRTIEEASEVLGRNVLQLDSKESLFSTVSVQLSLLIVGVALKRVLKSEGALPDIVAGHSIGAFSAAVAAETLAFKDAIMVVELRGKLMEKSYPINYGMGVIVGLNEIQVNIIVNRVNSGKYPIYIANLNTYDQIVISGHLKAIEEVFKLAKAMGANNTKLLNVSVPSHSKLLNNVAKEIGDKMMNTQLRVPKVLYVGNCRARVLGNPEAIKIDLSEGVCKTVRWYDTITLMYERGVRLFVELGPGEVLTNIAKKEFPDARCISLLNTGIQSTCILMQREKSKIY